MKLLAIDTSTEYLSLAASNGAKILCSQTILLKAKFSEKIMGHIDTVLKKSRVPVAKIDGFVVGLGPGSFTSLRVGLATVKGMVFAVHKPVIGISSLDAIAMNVAGDAENICVITDAKRSLVYSAYYCKRGKILERQGPCRLEKIEEILKGLPKSKADVILTGDALGLYGEEVKRLCPSGKWENKKHWQPQASSLLELARKRFEEKNFDDVDKLLPLYLYAEDCQVQKT